MQNSLTMYYIIYGVFFIFAVLGISVQTKHISNGLMVCFFIFLLLVGGLRGDFTTDYSSYVRQFEYFQDASITEFFNWDREVYWVEKLFALYLYVMGRLFQSPIPMFIGCVAVTLLPAFKEAKHSHAPWLFLFFYLCVGDYFLSFNLTRQVVAASLYFFALKYVREGKFLKYAIVCFVLSYVHVSTILMIPAYFLLRWKPSAKTIVLMLSGVAILMFVWDPLVEILDRLMFESKFTITNDLGGVDDWKTVIVPMCLGLFTLLQDRLTIPDKECNMLPNGHSNRSFPAEWIEWNSAMYWMLTYFLALKLSYFTRMRTFFSIAAICAITNAVADFQRDEKKALFVYLVCLVFSIYFLRFGQHDVTYFFYWQKPL